MNLKSTLTFIILFLLVVATKAQMLIPFYLVNGYILVDAEVNHVKGKFIFGTGTPLNFMINNNLVPLDKNSFLGTGNAGSRQVLDIYKSNIDRIKITQSELEFKNFQHITHPNFRYGNRC